MKFDKWRYAVASVIGTSHEKAGIPCQDASSCRMIETKDKESIFIAAVSDGAGSGKHSDIGAKLACELFLNEIDSFFECEKLPEEINEEFIKAWIKYFQNEISRRAEIQKVKSREYACTFLATIIGLDWATFIQIGDGAIVISSREEPEQYNWVFWPDKGEFENTTFFATEINAIEKIKFEFINKSIDQVSIFTDGLQALTLHYQSQTAFDPFFRPIFASLDNEIPSKLDNINSSLAMFLDSPSVNARTDDDKTLLIASRRSE